MIRRRIERVVVTLAGFFTGAMLAMCIAPGDVGLTLVAGAALTVFANLFFIRELGGELLWPWTRRNDPRCSPLRNSPTPVWDEGPAAGPRDVPHGRSLAERLTFRKAHRHGN